MINRLGLQSGIRIVVEVFGFVYSWDLLVSFFVLPGDLDSGKVVIVPKGLMPGGAHHHCPFCGLTRGFCALSHGNLPLAVHYNAMTPAFYGTFAVCAVASAVSLGIRLKHRIARS